MYKDKDKQREANRQAKAKQRAKGMTNKGMTSEGVTECIGVVHTANANLEPIVSFGKPKRGLDIKCFADLPPDVQATIDRMSITEGKVDEAEKAKRTAAAIRYQHLFPDRYYGAGSINLSQAVGD